MMSAIVTAGIARGFIIENDDQDANHVSRACVDWNDICPVSVN